MPKKVFKSKFFTDLSYEVIDEKWLDDDTYVIVFQDMKDGFGDTFHLEVEYHKDVNRITYVRVYEHEVIEAKHYITFGILKEIEEYILQQVGVIKGILTKQKIALQLDLDIDPEITMGELHEYLKTIKFEAVSTKFPNDEKVKCIKLTNLGWTK